MTTCPACKTTFKPRRSDARFCSRTCQSRAAAEISNAARGQAAIRNQGSGGNVVALSAIKPPLPVSVAPLSCPEGAPEIEWFDCSSTRYDQPYHRAVAGRTNRTRGNESILRSEAIGNDRPPIGHALMIDGEWIGRVRSRGAVIWASARESSLEAAKSAVENHLAGHVEIVTSAANLNRPEPMAIAA
jgi:hypothetical protein